MRSHARAEVQIPFSSKRKAQSIYKALKPETKVSFGSRSSVVVELKGRTLTMIALAQDVSALRAILNSYLRWIACCSDTISTTHTVDLQRMER